MSTSGKEDNSYQVTSDEQEKQQSKRRLSWNLENFSSIQTTSIKDTTPEDKSTLTKNQETSTENNTTSHTKSVTLNSDELENQTAQEKMKKNNFINNSRSINTSLVQKVADSVIPKSIKAGKPVMFFRRNEMRHREKKKTELPFTDESSSLKMATSEKTTENTSESEYLSEKESSTTVSYLSLIFVLIS